MTRNHARRLIVAAALVALGLGIDAAPAPAHTGVQFVIQIPASRTSPVVDGTCGGSEYTGAHSFFVFYRPGFDWPPARVQFLSDAGTLYVCASGLPLDIGTSTPSAVVNLDANHDGGVWPRVDDRRLTLTENNAFSVSDGTGRAWTHGSCTCVAAATRGETSWTAEFSISRLDAGGFGPGSITGFSFRNNDFPATGTDSAWPAVATRNTPGTWGDLIWFGRLAAPDFQLDTSRVTQGTQTDVVAHVTNDLVAGKSTLVQAQFYNDGAPATSVSASCNVVDPLGHSSSQTVPLAGPAVLNTVPYGFFNNPGSQARCRFAGSVFASPGVYHFSINGVENGTPFTLDMGTRTVLPTGDLRVFLWPAQFPTDSTRFAPFDANMQRAAIGDLAQMDRILPLRDGIGPANENGTTPMTAGLRFALQPSIWQCPTGVTPRSGPGTVLTCEDREYISANWDLFWRNVGNSLAAGRDGHSRDLFDQAETVTSTPQSSGGRSCWGIPELRPVAKAAFTEIDTNPSQVSAVVMTQELAHCWAELEHFGGINDPDRIPTNQWHSADHNVPLLRPDLAPVNLISGQDLPQAESVMFPTFDPVNDQASNYAMEGFAWNDMRRQLAIPGRTPSATAAAAPAITTKGLTYVFGGIVDNTGGVTPYFTEATKLPAGTATTPPDKKGAYSLNFVDSKDAVLARCPFAVTFDTTHDGTLGTFPLLITRAVPTGAAGVEILKGTTTLWSQAFSANPPQLNNLTATKNGQSGVDLSWGASDPDGDNLTYNVYLIEHPGAYPVPIYQGLTSPSFHWDSGMAPASTDAALEVEASDGFNSTRLTSNQFTIPEKPPVAGQIPDWFGRTLVANQPVEMSGWGFDFDNGAITDSSAFSWSSSIAGALGTGATLTTKLPAGSQSITLTVQAPNGQVGTDTVKVNVLADTDGDGMPNQYESQHACLKKGAADAAADPDQDGLTNAAEMELGTDPCNADTDGDGVSDGDEVEMGSSPTDAKSTPQSPAVLISSDDVDLKSCPSPAVGTVTLDTTKLSTRWYVAADPTQPWLTVSPSQGKGGATLTFTADCTGLPAGAENQATVDLISATHTYEIHVRLNS